MVGASPPYPSVVSATLSPRHTEGAAEEDALHRRESNEALGEASLFIHPLHGPPGKKQRQPRMDRMSWDELG